MTAQARTITATILFTDAVNSTELRGRVGEEKSQLIFEGHHKLLRDVVTANGGQEVKWEGDGLMAAFPSAADAVRCAIAMQQCARRAVAGERLEMRVGLNVGEVVLEEGDYSGMPVVIARRLCSRAGGGQILCSSLVAGLLAGRQAFKFRDCGQLELRGIADPVAACQVLYEVDELRTLLAQVPFVGRTTELARLHQKLEEARTGRGGLVMIVGEPGIGKTRIVEEFAETARNAGSAVLWGRCYEGEWAPAYSPFSEAIREYARTADPGQLLHDLGTGGGPVARLVPELRDRLPDIPEPAALQPDEERFRLIDSISRFLIAASARKPLVLVVDDLHWADKDSITMLRHIARFAGGSRLLLIGAYRDVELDRQHPLAEALASLRSETHYERVVLRGLDQQEVRELLAIVMQPDAPDSLVNAISAETDGNPLFIIEVLRHLTEKGVIYRHKDRWISDLAGLEELGIPEGIRLVIGRRLSRLSGDANRLLTVASAFSGTFRFDIAARVARIEEAPALNAVDEALEALVLRPGAEVDMYDFTHAAIRHTLYAELSPSRQVRLHRQIAEAMEQVHGERAAQHAAELAYQYYRSAALPGAERGVDHALTAAEQAEAIYARDEAASFLRIALELLPENDVRRPRLLGRLGLALAWALDFEEARKAASEAGERIAELEGEDAAADYLAEATRSTSDAGFERGAWALSSQGLAHARGRRDITWATLMIHDLTRREAEDPEHPGIILDTPERRELSRFLRSSPPRGRGYGAEGWSSRREVLANAANEPFALAFYAGEYRRSLGPMRNEALESEAQGRIARAVHDWGEAARCHIALGELDEAREAYGRARALYARLPGRSPESIWLGAASYSMALALDSGWERELRRLEAYLREPTPEYSYAHALARAWAAQAYARLRLPEEAIRWLGSVVASLERAPGPGWAPNYLAVVCSAANCLWLLERTDHVEIMERNLREKVVAPDFRYPMMDGRLALAWVCALQNRFEEAIDWFAKARAVLDEQGARPLRAITDYDEALMYVRRAAPGDGELAAPLLAAALQQFRDLEMAGWIERAEAVV